MRDADTAFQTWSLNGVPNTLSNCKKHEVGKIAVSTVVEELFNKAKIFLSYTYQPLFRPVYFYDNCVENDDEDGQKFLRDISIAYFLSVLLLLSVFDEGLSSFPFFGINSSDYPIKLMNDIVMSFGIFMAIINAGAVLGGIESFAIFFLKFKNFSLRNYIYYKIIMTCSCVVIFFFLFIIASLVNVIVIRLFGISTPVHLVSVFISAIILIYWFVSSWIVLHNKTETWWVIIPSLMGYPFIYGIFYNLVPDSYRIFG